MKIPRYLLENIARHARRVVSNVRASPSDTATVNAVRLLRKELAKLDGIINEDKQDD